MNKPTRTTAQCARHTSLPPECAHTTGQELKKLLNLPRCAQMPDLVWQLPLVQLLIQLHSNAELDKLPNVSLS